MAERGHPRAGAVRGHQPWPARPRRTRRENLGDDPRCPFELGTALAIWRDVGMAWDEALTTIDMASLTAARKRGRDSRRIRDIKQLHVALEMYYQFHTAYPTTLSALTGSNFIPVVPNDPLTGLPYAYVALQGAGGTAAICASYHLGAKLEIYTTSNFADDVDAPAGGTYPTGDGPNCANSSWAGNADIAATASGGTGNDFYGTNDSVNRVYDMRP